MRPMAGPRPIARQMETGGFFQPHFHDPLDGMILMEKRRCDMMGRSPPAPGCGPARPCPPSPPSRMCPVGSTCALPRHSCEKNT
ncbi:hypothetical protein CFR76_01970 [Komagataeibacter swingsii]|uniref:Uncharacterized protein n=1 Tax=Komagataeibacter swingsii TaxID=215220 RepID=A0A2V4RFF5_9PROT|nr:hypothetical protein CFR76_01970 [Komagataeibacter swingsii]